jgi:hypothetical protein
MGILPIVLAVGGKASENDRKSDQRLGKGARGRRLVIRFRAEGKLKRENLA